MASGQWGIKGFLNQLTGKQFVVNDTLINECRFKKRNL